MREDHAHAPLVLSLARKTIRKRMRKRYLGLVGWAAGRREREEMGQGKREPREGLRFLFLKPFSFFYKSVLKTFANSKQIKSEIKI